MAWYAYCISEQANFQQGRVRRPFLIESLKGVHASPVRGFPCGEFVVIVSEIEHGNPLSQQAAMEHARIVSECFKVATLLPFKFGTVFESDDALRQAIRNNKKTFADSIAKLRGKSEMHIKVTVREGTAIAEVLAVLPHKAGGEYLTRLKEQASRDRERQSRARALSRAGPQAAEPAAGGGLLQEGGDRDRAGHCPPDRLQRRGEVPEPVFECAAAV